MQIAGIEMMGRQEVAQAPLFYAFNLEAHIPANHLLRGIGRFLDLSELPCISRRTTAAPAGTRSILRC
ncbi:MAG TPA: hypothetical protein VFJ87_07295 [Rhodanobacteraceae bacterium]|jgi:hypothetical protein|nr:hypothetical protein [Rhodanobacteraceae bacterium]